MQCRDSTRCPLSAQHDATRNMRHSLATYGSSFMREYLSRVSSENDSVHSPVMPALHAKYRNAAGATSAGVCADVALAARSCDRKDSVDVAQPDRPQPTM